MVVKILCHCGTKYKFDVEPLDGRLPGAVQCPVCGADGTVEGNEIVARELTAAPAGELPATNRSRIVVPAIPKSSKAVSADASVSPAPSPQAIVPTPRAAVLSVPAAPEVSHIRSAPPVPAPVPAAAKPKASPGAPHNALGIVGAVAAGVIGMFIWYGITLATNSEFGLLAWGLGGLIGAAARVLGNGGSRVQGFAAGAVAVCAILGGQYLATRHLAQNFISLAIDGAFEIQTAYAKEVTEAKNDAELKTAIAKHESDDETTVEPGDIDAARLADFRKNELPRLKKISGGALTKSEFERDYRNMMNEALSGAILKESFGVWTLLWLFLGVGTAFRLGSGN